VMLPGISSEMWGDSLEFNAPPSPRGSEAEGRDDTPDFAVPSRAVAASKIDVPRPDGEQDEGEGLVFSTEDGADVETPADAALTALDGMVGGLFRSFLVDAPPPVENDGGRTERRKREIPPAAPFDLDGPFGGLFDVLPRALSDFGTVLISESRERRRLSEGGADPRSEVRERIGRRLTEYVLMTETYFAPGGGSVTFHTSSALPDLAPLRGSLVPPSRQLGGGGGSPKLGFATAEVDRCIYERYLRSDLSRGCADAVAQLNAMTARVRSRRDARLMEAQAALDAGAHPGGMSGPCPLRVAALSAACLAFLLVGLRCLGAVSVLWSLAVAASVAAFGYGALLVAVPVAFLMDYLSDDDDEGEDGEEDEVGFDYVKCPGDEEGQPQPQRGQGRRDLRPVPVPHPPVHGEHAVYVGVPIQVV